MSKRFSLRKAAWAFVLGLAACLGCFQVSDQQNSSDEADAKTIAPRGVTPAVVPVSAGKQPPERTEAKPLTVKAQIPGLKGQIGESKPAQRAVEPGAEEVQTDMPPSAGSPTGPRLDSPQPRVGDSYSAKIDPVVVNGPVFDDWPKPKLLLVFSGEQNGYLEPCGCAGLENMKGGLMRRDTLLRELREERGWPVAAVDNGNMVARFGKQAEIKYALAVDSFKEMGYDAIALGPDDLRLGVDPLLPQTEGNASPYVAANVGLFGLDSGLPRSFHTFERGGLKVGVTAVLGEEYQKGLADDVLTFAPAAESIRTVLPKLQAEECDVLILLAHARHEESRALAKAFPEFDFVVTADGAPEPPFKPEKFGDKTWLLEVGKKGMYVIAVGLFDDAEQPRRYQRVTIDARYADSPRIRDRMFAMQDELQCLVEQLGWEKGLGVKPLPHPSGRTFVGSQACKDCHAEAFDIWEKTPHAHATQTLAEIKDRHGLPNRTFDAECLSCHVTGWEPQRYFPFQSGFDALEKSQHLVGSGCENCHGPGSRHVAIELGELEASDEDQHAAQAEMRLTIEQARDRTCSQCHDLDNSPDYVKKGFDAYWPKVAH